MKNDMKKLRDAGHEAIRKKESLIFMNDQQDYFSAVVDLLRTYIFLGNCFADQLFQLTRGSEEMVTLFRKLFVLFDSPVTGSFTIEATNQMNFLVYQPFNAYKCQGFSFFYDSMMPLLQWLCNQVRRRLPVPLSVMQGDIVVDWQSSDEHERPNIHIHNHSMIYTENMAGNGRKDLFVDTFPLAQ